MIDPMSNSKRINNSMRPSPETVIRPEIMALQSYHVADATGMVKLDAMENPYRLPQAVLDQLSAVTITAEINRYPDPQALALKAMLRQSLQIPDQLEILLGNGSDEIIQMLIMAVAKPGAVVLGVEPAFVMFKMISVLCGARFVGVPLDTEFNLDLDVMLAVIEKESPQLIFIAYPNNPTGNLFDSERIERVIAAAPGLVVIDEAYQAFAEKTFMDRLSQYPNVVLMRTLSKSGLAGLRLGVLVGARVWISAIDKLRLPYNINVLTQLTAAKVLAHESLLAEQAALLRAERTQLYLALQTIAGVVVYQSAANFLLFRIADATTVFNRLKDQGVLIKDLNGSHKALVNCLRVTVGKPEENAQFIAALRASIY